MKVALVLFDWFEHGGLQRDCRRIGESLLSKGTGVTLICMHTEANVPDGFALVKPELTGSSKKSRRKHFVDFLHEHFRDTPYDIVFGFNRVPGLDFYFAADTCFAWKTKKERNWFYRLSPRTRQYMQFEKAVFNPQSNTKLLMLSPMQKQEYLSCYPAASARMIDISPGIARDRMAGSDAQELRSSLREEFSVANDELFILQVGTGYPIKGVDRSLTAIAALHEEVRSRVRFFILGEDRRGRYMKQALQLGIAEQVNILAGRNDMPRFLQGADLLLQPSRKESAGMVILEAIVAGLPVLATETCGYAFHVTQAEAGQVIGEPYSQHEMIAVLTEMLECLDNEKGKHWQENGIAYGQQGDFYAMPDQVAELLIETVNGSKKDTNKETKTNKGVP